ncbi:MAG: DUF2284 domain-containing protein [Eubacterium sp.]
MDDQKIYNKVITYIKKNYSKFKFIQLNKNDFIFQNRVKLKCFHCAKYKTSWTCPPNIPDIDYQELINEYENILLLYVEFPFNDDQEFQEIRAESTVELHKTILEIEKFLYQSNIVLYNSFIGGSCKLCKNGCPPDKCRNPYVSRIPMEAMGINVVETLRRKGIDIHFPPKEKLYRFGLIMF